MVIEVRLYATLRRYAPPDSAGMRSVDIPEGCTAGELLGIIGVDPEEVHLLMVNGVNAAAEQVLWDGDRVGLFPVVGGG